MFTTAILRTLLSTLLGVLLLIGITACEQKTETLQDTVIIDNLNDRLGQFTLKGGQIPAGASTADIILVLNEGKEVGGLQSHPGTTIANQ